MDSSVPCGLSVEQQRECEWRRFVLELQQRFIGCEYEYRVASRNQSENINGRNAKRMSLNRSDKNRKVEKQIEWVEFGRDFPEEVGPGD